MNRFTRIGVEYDVAHMERLVRFIEAYAPAAGAARFEFSLSHTNRIGGEAVFCGDPVYPVLIKMKLSQEGARSYPATERYLLELPPLEVDSREEELLLVLAHEMRHAVQFMTDLGDRLYWNPGYMELDAETFAYNALFAWRAHQKQFLAKAA